MTPTGQSSKSSQSTCLRRHQSLNRSPIVKSIHPKYKLVVHAFTAPTPSHMWTVHNTRLRIITNEVDKASGSLRPHFNTAQAAAAHRSPGTRSQYCSLTPILVQGHTPPGVEQARPPLGAELYATGTPLCTPRALLCTPRAPHKGGTTASPPAPSCMTLAPPCTPRCKP